MKSAREPIWWLPLLRRVVGWGLATALIAGILPFLVVVTLLNLIILGPYQDATYVEPSFWDTIISDVAISFLVSSPLLLTGLILGAITGFYAPATEPKNLLKSKFFRAVAAQTSSAWAFSFGVLSLTFYYGFPYFDLKVPRFAVLALAIILFGLSLWRAINRALDAVKLK